MKLVNLTQHDIIIYKNDNIVETIKPINKKKPVRADEKIKLNREISGYPDYDISYHDVKSIPAPQRGVFYIVSLITALQLHAAGRNEDIRIIAEAVRDEEGYTIGCRGFSKIV